MSDGRAEIQRHIAAVTMSGGDFRWADPFLLEDLLSERRSCATARATPGKSSCRAS